MTSHQHSVQERSSCKCATTYDRSVHEALGVNSKQCVQFCVLQLTALCICLCTLMLALRVASKNSELRISPRNAVATTSAANVHASHTEPWSLLALQYFSHLVHQYTADAVCS
jgi:hypothetical protein